MTTAPPNARDMTPAEFRKALIQVAFEDQARLAKQSENASLKIIHARYGKPQTEKK
ncbi:hypothetical protein [Halothiobacillus sp.]|uniref:hypothetical protein n=1 Tax=Halothiobacillus sp. TaxID=1891311 RepID=UPI0026152305|nr:hypothetical protein [Halothiobacillus sp.]